MPAFEDDDALGGFPSRPTREHSSRERKAGRRSARGKQEFDWELEDDGHDHRPLVPDEMMMVRCTICRKLILEDTIRCPYCRHLQLELQESGSFWLAGILVVSMGIAAGCMLMYCLGWWPGAQ